jgi:hypothetical protein
MVGPKEGRWIMRWVVGAFYAGLVVFAGWAGGVKMGAYVLAAAIALIIMLRPLEAGRAVSDWAGRVFQRHEIRTSS